LKVSTSSEAAAIYDRICHSELEYACSVDMISGVILVP